ncbi:MAG: aconitate hydratase [Verrucomicrobiales bacterium]|nr:aconitate hydratase [Verrucomicrobiales bacterium]
MNVAEKLINRHLADGEMKPGREVSLKIDQTLTQDATGTLVMLELEAMGLEQAQTELSAQYVDHNLLQQDYKNPDDHAFLESACEKFGIWFSRPGNGVSHPVHQERFGVPGKTLLGSDSHTCAAGSIGMLAIGAGGIEVAMAIAGQPYLLKMPEILGVKLSGELPPWVSAKDVILEMLRRHGVKGGIGKIIEYYGPGLACLSTMDRHVIANMGAELGATTSVFPSDSEVRRFLHSQQRGKDWIELKADDHSYDYHDEIVLDDLEPLVALPSSPGKVKPVREVEGKPIAQCYIGSSANPGFSDFAAVAEIVAGKQIAPGVSLDINPTSRQILENLVYEGQLGKLIHAGARIHQAGCNGCIGMGQAPATDRISLRTVPRNFPGRSGTKEDKVYLVSPETAAASALEGKITDPRDLKFPPPSRRDPERPKLNREMMKAPRSGKESRQTRLVKGPNIASLPDFEPLPENLEIPVLLRLGDDVSTDEIMPAGSRVLPFRSNIPEISRFCFDIIDATYHQRTLDIREQGGHAVVGGENYGQGSSREHAAIAPRFLGLRAVLALSFARIHWRNLISFGIIPLTLTHRKDLDRLNQTDVLKIDNVREQVATRKKIVVTIPAQGLKIETSLQISSRQVDILFAGGLINWMKDQPVNRYRSAPDHDR